MPKPAAFVAGGTNYSLPANPVYPQASTSQNFPHVAVSNSGTTASPYSAFLSPILGTSMISSPMSTGLVPQSALPFLTSSGGAIGTPFYPTYPSISSTGRNGFSIPASDGSVAVALLAGSDKSIPFYVG